MSLLITIPNGGPAGEQPELPSNYSGLVLRGANTKAFSHGATEGIIQNINYNDFAIRLFCGQFLKKFEIKNWFLLRGLYTSFVLKNGIRKKISNLGKIHLRKDHHLITYNSNAHLAGIIDQNSQFQILDIFYSRALLAPLVACFPELKPVIATEKNVIVGKRTYWTPLHVREIYTQLLDSDFDAATRQLYFDLKVREILLHLLQNSLGLACKEQIFTPYEVARIHEAKAILENSIDKKPPTIRELSRMVALNEFKLKQGFRKYFNSGIFSWVISLKMHRAKQLLEETTKPIKEIAALTGYPRTTNFITAFRKHHGVTPGAIRRS